MKFFFALVTRTALRLRWLTIAMVFVLLALGVYAANDLNQELLPPIELPQTIILGQVAGMTSEQVLTVMTERLEEALAGIDEIVNLESQTTGAFGTVMIAFNDFGINQPRLVDEIRAQLDAVWFPLRRIEAPPDVEPQVFASQLLGDLSPEVMLYLAENDTNFLFQLAPSIWEVLAEDTVRVVAAYLAQQDEGDIQVNPLERLVEKEIAPQLRALDNIASVSVDGGQALPGEEARLAVASDPDPLANSLLLRLSPEVWDIISARLDLGEQNTAAVQRLSEISVAVPVLPPPLPESWQFDQFRDAQDLVEMQTITLSTGQMFNRFYNQGRIVGALGQTDDLTPEIVSRMLEIEPTLVEYFDADHLVRMSPEVFAVLPDDFIANLDGFTRDALAAAALAQRISGEVVERAPVDLPGPWMIQPPQVITFSFADIPLATFSVAGTASAAVDAPQVVQPAPQADTQASTPATGPANNIDAPNRQAIPEGPPLPPIFQTIGAGFGAELNTADDLIAVPLPPELAETAGIDSLSAADILNLLVAPPEGFDDVGPALPANVINLLIASLNTEIVSFIAEYDPNFLPALAPQVYERLSDPVLLLPQVAPPVSEAWSLLVGQPEFTDDFTGTLDDLILMGEGSPAATLNLINADIPATFAGYEMRLFDSITPAEVRYFRLYEPDFFERLDDDVLRKFSQPVLALIPADVLDSLDDALAAELRAIISGEQDSAFAAQQALYVRSIPPSDPDAPALNAEWTFLEPSYGIQLRAADDFFRFPENYVYTTAAELINSVFQSPQGVSFAPDLLGNMPVEAIRYIVDRDASTLLGLETQALQLLPSDGLVLLPQELQDQAREGGDRFIPVSQVTRTNGSPSLFVTVFKDADANTVVSFSQVNRIMQQIDAENEEIQIGIVFEQSSFIEDSISGVAREGSLGAVFAVVIILTFLSSGVWHMPTRRRAGAVLTVIFAGLMLVLVLINLDGDGLRAAFDRADVVLRVLLMVGIAAGLVILFWPGRLPAPAWRATIVIAVSIPLSILTALVGMRWVSPFMHELILPLSEQSGALGDFFSFVLRLFPDQLTLNIMTLSGLTVAVGRVVDDSIVVLENIVRYMQAGGDKKTAVLEGTRDVSAAIFTASMIALIVFLPLGLTGGIVGAFFLPFGLAVTYALFGSFAVAVTVVPVLAYLFIDVDELPEEGDIWVARYYRPLLAWALSSRATRATVIAIAFGSMIFGFFLFGQRPAAFLPDFGEPQVSVDVSMPPGTDIATTNSLVREIEEYLFSAVPAEQLRAIQTTVGGGGANFETLLTGSGVNESQANVVVGLSVGQRELDDWTRRVRQEADTIFGEDNVTVSSASIAEAGIGGFSLVVSGPADELAALDALVIETLNGIDGITNVSSNLSQANNGGDGEENNGPLTIIRINRQSALSYTGELETQNTIGVTAEAVDAVRALPELRERPHITVSQGFSSEIQTEGFNSLPIAMMIAVVIVVTILIFTFQSLVYWFAIILSIVVAPVGAAIALTLTDRVLGISALIGLLMLLGLVVTNAVVLIDRVRSNRSERGLGVYDALIEAGGRRLRPILMTSLATIIALIPLAIGLSDGAIIASELGTVVIGGVFSSTMLTLIVVPVMYSLLHPLHQRLSLRREVAQAETAADTE